MLELQLKQIKTSVGSALGLCVGDTRLLSYVNRATQRLLYIGKWKGTICRYRICATEGVLVWPRQIETIEAYAVCNRPGTPRSGWFEYLGSGPGVLNGQSCAGNQLIDREDVCSFSNIIGTGKKLAVYCDKQEDVGSTITLQYYDSGNQFVRTTFNNTLVDGERIALPAAGTYAYSASTVLPGGLVQVYKDQTKGIVRLYEYDTTTALLRPLGYYAPDETVPVYRSSELPGFVAGSSDGGCTGTQVDVRAKIRFIPVADDDDFLVISHEDAIRLAAQGVLKEENGKIIEAQEYFSTAIRLLDQQLKHWRGTGAVAPVVFHDQPVAYVQNLL